MFNGFLTEHVYLVEYNGVVFYGFQHSPMFSIYIWYIQLILPIKSHSSNMGSRPEILSYTWFYSIDEVLIDWLTFSLPPSFWLGFSSVFLFLYCIIFFICLTDFLISSMWLCVFSCKLYITYFNSLNIFIIIILN